MLGEAELVEERLPCGDRGQWQRGGLGEVEAVRHVADDPAVNHLLLGVASGSVDRAGVIDPVSGREVHDAGPDREHNSGGVVAEDPRSQGGIEAGTQLDVDRVHRHGADLDEQIVVSHLRQLHVDLDKRLGSVHRTAAQCGDGPGDSGRFHGVEDNHRRPVH